MPVFHDYSENGKLLSTRNEPLNVDNLPRYLTEFGTERAEGYREAVADMLQLLGPAIWSDYIPNEAVIYQPSLRRSMLPLVDIFRQQTEFLDQFSKVVISQLPPQEP